MTSPGCADEVADDVDRSPVDLVLSADESWLATVNQTSDTVSLVRIADGEVLDEAKIGRRPTGIALHPNGKQLVTTASYSGDVVLLTVNEERLNITARIQVGFEPHGVAINAAGTRAYVAMTAAAKVAVVDLKTLTLETTIDVGRWPRQLALSPDEKRLAVATSGDRGISVVDIASGKLDFIEAFNGINIGHLRISRDGEYAYFPWMIYRKNPITAGNIRLGWVLATRLARVKLGEQARREALSLDPRGKAIADPYGIDFTSDEQRLVVSASGTHELLVYRAPDLPFEDFGGTDHIPNAVLRNRDRFYRIDIGGRPMGLRIGQDDSTVYVANYLDNSVQLVDIKERALIRAIRLGGAKEPSLVRQGETIFYDGRRSLDQWYSCHSCHYEGGGNSVVMDTFNDDSSFTFKTVLPLYNVTKTSPWTWHGWQKDLRAAMNKSITSTMLGPKPSANDIDALLAYLNQLKPGPNSNRNSDGTLSEAAQRGRSLFNSEKTQCASCHSGPQYTDNEIHEVGLASTKDRYKGFNTPSLVGVHHKVLLLHDGRAKSLHDLLAKPHSPAKVSGTEPLSEKEIADLVEYLKTL